MDQLNIALCLRSQMYVCGKYLTGNHLTTGKTSPFVQEGGHMLVPKQAVDLSMRQRGNVQLSYEQIIYHLSLNVHQISTIVCIKAASNVAVCGAKEYSISSSC
jgi:hypothetical protein